MAGLGGGGDNPLCVATRAGLTLGLLGHVAPRGGLVSSYGFLGNRLEGGLCLSREVSLGQGFFVSGACGGDKAAELGLRRVRPFLRLLQAVACDLSFGIKLGLGCLGFDPSLVKLALDSGHLRSQEGALIRDWSGRRGGTSTLEVST